MWLWTLWLGPWLLMSSARGDIHVGAALNVFTSFGDLGAVVKVKGHGEHWFPEYHSADVFETVLETRSPLSSPDEAEFNGDFLLQLCDNANQLKTALFHGHGLEGAERPWRAYTGGWSNNMAAAHLGINSSYLLRPHGYALVRLSRHHEQVTLSPDYDLHFNQWTTEGASKVIPEQPETVFNFIGTFGTHYVSSYISGDSLYQVFVFSPTVYEDLKKAMREYEVTGQGLEQVLNYFTPWHAEHIGRIVSLSGNGSVEQWAEQHLQSRMLVFIYSSLLNLHSAPDLLPVLNLLLGNDALLSVQLKSLAPYFTDKRRQLWFREVVDNHMKLWEISV